MAEEWEEEKLPFCCYSRAAARNNKRQRSRDVREDPSPQSNNVIPPRSDLLRRGSQKSLLAADLHQGQVYPPSPPAIRHSRRKHTGVNFSISLICNCNVMIQIFFPPALMPSINAFGRARSRLPLLMRALLWSLSNYGMDPR